MRLKKGTKVEVLNKREDPAGSWWCAEISSGNGHSYYVRYDRNLPDVDSSVERVPRSAIRPCPPAERSRLDWIPGDNIEVLNNFSWMLAKIKMFTGGQYYSVRLTSSSAELTVHSSCIRLRKCWQGNKWVIIPKDSGKRCYKITNRISNEELISSVPRHIDHLFQANKNISDEDSCPIVARNVKKRSRSCPRAVEKCTGPFRKKRAVEKEGIRQGVFAWNPMLEKIDAVPSPQTLFGEKYMHNSLININREICEAIQVVQKANAVSEHYLRLMLERTDAESVSSSVGSCGVNKSPFRSTCHTFNDSGQYMESHHDLLQASTTLGREASFTTAEEVHQDIHSLELHAYRSTMAAFFASGPINWEQEALLTNLRRMLHISNDEHLTELKNLASVD